MKSDDHLLLKWGTLKGWDFKNHPELMPLLEEYHNIGASLSFMMQRDTPRQQEIILEIIDKFEGSIHNDWSGDDYTNNKQDAKDYIINYKR